MTPGITLGITPGMTPRAEKQVVPTITRPRVARVITAPLILGLVVALSSCGDGEDAVAQDDGDAPPTAEEIRAAAGTLDADPSSTSGTAPREGGAGSASATSGSGTATAATGGAGAPSDAASGSAPAPGSPSSASAGGPPYGVQVGAFARDGNVTELRSRLEDAGFPVWTRRVQDADAAELVQVRVGVVPRMARARELMELLRERLGEDPELEMWIAPLATEGTAPDGMMEATATLLEDG